MKLIFYLKRLSCDDTKEIISNYPLFHLFSYYHTNLISEGIRTWIVGVEGEDADY